MGERQVVGHALVLGAGLVLLFADAFEEEGFANHLDAQARDFPMTGRDFGLHDVKLAAFIEMAEKSAAELLAR